MLCLSTGKWKIADEFKQIINIRYVLSAYLDIRLLLSLPYRCDINDAVLGSHQFDHTFLRDIEVVTGQFTMLNSFVTFRAWSRCRR
jgi:hypothetical protein